jgi:hypothetical protein
MNLLIVYIPILNSVKEINQAVTWETYDSLRVNIVDSMAFIACFTHKDTVSLSCAINDVVKNIYCKVSNSTKYRQNPGAFMEKILFMKQEYTPIILIRLKEQLIMSGNASIQVGLPIIQILALL